MPPTVKTILAGSFSLPLRRPDSSASRTAFSISRCEVMPTFFRNLRRLALNASSFMVISCLRVIRVGHHVIGEVALLAVGAGDRGIARRVAVLAAIDVVG